MTDAAPVAAWRTAYAGRKRRKSSPGLAFPRGVRLAAVADLGVLIFGAVGLRLCSPNYAAAGASRPRNAIVAA